MSVYEPRSPHVRLAAEAIDAYVRERQIIPIPTDPPKEFLDRAGVFVCLKRHGQLRGCIGTIEPCYSTLAEEIIRNAILAATRDPRFSPVNAMELPDLHIGVDVLMPPEPANGMEDLDVKRYGVIVQSGHRRGLLLPDLEGVETPEQQVAIAMQKAGIYTDESLELLRFEVVRYD